MNRLIILLRIATLNVLRYRRRSLITAFAVTMAVFVMVSVRALVNGTEVMVLDQFVYGQYGALQIHKKGYLQNVNRPPLSFAFNADDAFMNKVRAIPGVRAASARVVFPAVLGVGDRSVVSPAFGIDPVNEYEVCPFKRDDVAEGKPVDATGVVFSPLLRRQLGVKVGSEITLVAPDFEGVMNAAIVQTSGFIADVPLMATTKKLSFVSLPVAQELLRLPHQAIEIAIRVDDYNKTESVAKALAAVIGPDLEINPWQDRAGMVLDSLAQRRVILNYVTSIFLLIALLGVTNTMLMSVLGRTREIGTMMAVGMRRRQILTLFIAEAGVLGFLGSLAGVLVGQALGTALRWKGLAITIPGGATTLLLRPFAEWPWALTIAGVVAIGSAVASIYPALRAARLKPIEAMAAL